MKTQANLQLIVHVSEPPRLFASSDRVFRKPPGMDEGVLPFDPFAR
jgi:hypothetical protein